MIRHPHTKFAVQLAKPCADAGRTPGETVRGHETGRYPVRATTTNGPTSVTVKRGSSNSFFGNVTV